MKEPEKIRVLLADGDKQFCIRAAETLKNCPQIALIGIVQSGEEALRTIHASKPSLLVIDAALPKTDGLLIAKQLRDSGVKTGVMMLSVFISRQFSAECELLGVDTLLHKPVLPEVLLERILLWSDAKAQLSTKNIDKNLRRRIQTILSEIGMSAGTKGYNETSEAIHIVATSERAISGITKEVYPAVAKKFGTRASRVERNIRNAIESAWTHGSIERQQYYMGTAFKPDNGRPSNRDFINKIANILLYEED
ncbi:sporulation initiation factor Spo0A C-terminal domain-containing protein [Agathobaculum sp.]|uniref:sporulation initiation factor Spo0A C-terminal domain-containing protein n=1 Tax=Agathobaculum sp. TaxID=2048138 RepID=UPI002A80A3B4|nr:sporulation initiation factor Spo0A C-terminal domain-containing protein [Agathobaculum sp.]MDY3618336.1 sporulation initiation factor Spo0A C-terminal domain-containing protein [Agathobaculum sp.]